MRKILQSIASRFRRPRSKTTVLLSLAVAVLLALNVYQYDARANLRAQLQASSPQPSAPAQVIPLASIDETNSPQYDAMIAVLKFYQPSIRYLTELVDIYQSNAFTIPNDGTMYYHRFYCPYYDHLEEFFVLNREYAKNLGYLPCPKCISTDSDVYKSSFEQYDRVCDLIYLISYATEADWMELGSFQQSLIS